MLFTCEAFTAVMMAAYLAAATAFSIFGIRGSLWLLLPAVLCLFIVLLLAIASIFMFMGRKSRICGIILSIFGGIACIYYWKWYSKQTKKEKQSIPSDMMRCPFCQSVIKKEHVLCPNCKCPLHEDKGSSMTDEVSSCE